MVSLLECLDLDLPLPPASPPEPPLTVLGGVLPVLFSVTVEITNTRWGTGHSLLYFVSSTVCAWPIIKDE